MSPTVASATGWRLNSGERMKPMIGMPSRIATVAPATCVPSSPNWRRLSRRGSRSPIANESIEDAHRSEHDEQEGDRCRPADQPDEKDRLPGRLPSPPSQAAKDDADEQQGERDHHE